MYKQGFVWEWVDGTPNFRLGGFNPLPDNKILEKLWEKGSRKQLGEGEIAITSVFSFFHHVFKRPVHVLQTCTNKDLFGNALMVHLISDWEGLTHYQTTKF